MQIIEGKRLKDVFLDPAAQALKASDYRRKCPDVSDWQWIEMGLSRTLDDVRSGRDFLQKWNLNNETQEVGYGQFFEVQRSARRLNLVRDVNQQVAQAMAPHVYSKIDTLDGLTNFDIYAGDGHYIGASTHDEMIDGKRRAVGHFYTLDFRSCSMTHLTGSDLQGGLKKSEHDMHALKRQNGEALRQGAKKGRKVLYVWDPAGIDFNQWNRWKQASGVYFLSRVKENMKFIEYKKQEWDPDLPVNAGVLSDQRVHSVSSMTHLRLITYQCPDSGTVYEFITSEMTLAAGILAWLYKRRWDLEKTYDTFKNKIAETKAWGKSDQAKQMQAQFICLTHNLMLLLEQKTGITDQKETDRATRRFETQVKRAKALGRTFAPQHNNPRKRTQIGLKFIRWLRNQINAAASFARACARLRHVYDTF